MVASFIIPRVTIVYFSLVSVSICVSSNLFSPHHIIEASSMHARNVEFELLVAVEFSSVLT